MLIIAPWAQIFSQYVCLKLHSQIPIHLFILFLLLCLNCWVHNIFVFTLSSWIHNESHDVLHLWKNYSGKRNRKSGIKKQIKACTVLKIRFGSNYIDRCTALVIQNNVLNMTISLLLLKWNIRFYKTKTTKKMSEWIFFRITN
jgi:hypothetical protein